MPAPDTVAQFRKEQFRRDLLWVINSPRLLLDTPLTKLDEGQIDSDSLAKTIGEKPSHRVGYYFEALFLHWLTCIRRQELIAHRLQLQDATGRTTGELDFLVRDDLGQLCHWETAVKFYLHFPNEHRSHHICLLYTSPSPRDS